MRGDPMGGKRPPLAGRRGLVVADLMGCGIAVCVIAAIPCVHSVAPPLPIEAAASIGTFRKVPRAILWVLSHRGESTAPPARRTAIRQVRTISFRAFVHKSRRSACFVGKRRNDRTLARDHGSFGNRDHDAREVHSDDGRRRHPPTGTLPQRMACAQNNVVPLRAKALVLLRKTSLIRRSAPASPRGSQDTCRSSVR